MLTYECARIIIPKTSSKTESRDEIGNRMLFYATLLAIITHDTANAIIETIRDFIQEISLHKQRFLGEVEA